MLRGVNHKIAGATFLVPRESLVPVPYFSFMTAKAQIHSKPIDQGGRVNKFFVKYNIWKLIKK